MFGEGHAAVHAVNGVDLTIQPGEIVLVMGPSGSGKTTLLSMLGGLLRPTGGRIRVAGEEITALSQAELAAVRQRLVGFVFQSFNLLDNLTAAENVEIVQQIAKQPKGEAKQRARELLSAFGLSERMDFRAASLSGGEKQRVSIARALANDPRIILADEPTANLDSKHGKDVMVLLQQIARDDGRAVVVVSHDHRIREVADRVLWLEDGHLRSIGKLVQDPMCGMSVEADASVTATIDGDAYFFCSAGCRDQFLASQRPGAEAGF